MSEVLDIEAEGARIKSLCVLIGGEFRLHKPNHEFTAHFNEIEAHIYQSHERLIRLTREIAYMRLKMAQIESSEDMEFGESNEKVIIHDFRPISETEYERSNSKLMTGTHLKLPYTDNHEEQSPF